VRAQEEDEGLAKGRTPEEIVAGLENGSQKKLQTSRLNIYKIFSSSFNQTCRVKNPPKKLWTSLLATTVCCLSRVVGLESYNKLI